MSRTPKSSNGSGTSLSRRLLRLLDKVTHTIRSEISLLKFQRFHAVRFEPRIDYVSVPFRLIDNRILVDVGVNGLRPLSFIFDTGASASIIDTTLPKKLNLKVHPGRTGKFGAGGQEIQLDVVEKAEVQLHRLTVTIKNILVTNIHQVADVNAGIRVDGILGGTFIKNFVVDIDYGNGILKLVNPGGIPPEFPEDAVAVPIETSGGSPLIQVFGTTRSDEFQAKMQVDTGSQEDIIFTKPFANTKQSLSKMEPSIPSVVFGVSGESAVRVGRLKSIELRGSKARTAITIQRPLALVGQTADGSLGSTEYDGIFGGAILSRFLVRFDYGKSTMSLARTSRVDERYNYDMSGIIAAEESQGLGDFKVVFVIPDSPAGDAEIRKNDIIQCIDNCKAADWTLPEFRHICEIEGRKCVLRIRRGKKMLKRTITMRPLI